MAQYDVIIITIAMTLTVISTYILYLLRKTPQFKTRSADEYNLLKAVVTEFDNREENQNRKIAELMLKIDLLEDRMTKGQAPKRVTYEIPARENAVEVTTQPERKTIEEVSLGFGSVEDQILRFVATGPKTSREVQISIRRSREHTARLLKSLYEKGYLDRENRGKYFVYSITESGRRVIVQR
ncbi:MAG: winged helix DNA-binding protein [Nitrososphaeria archaeon]